MIDLSGKVAIVTGGTGQIGYEVVRSLIDSGALVALTYNTNKLKALQYCYYLETDKPRAFPFQLDIKSPKSINRCIGEIGDKYERVDILVNNAGVNIPASLDEIDLFEWEEVLSVNLRGPWLFTRMVARDLLKPGASIINIGSVSGHIGGPVSTHYAASKAGLVALTHNMAKYYAPEIRCNLIAPGYIRSEMAQEGAKNRQVQKIIEAIPLGRMGVAEEVAKVAVFLASSWSSYMTGATIHVNGGLYM